MLCAYASHGDTKHICLYPVGPARSASSWRSKAFDLAERFQTPVFVLSRPRHRHERLGGAAAASGTTATAPTAAGCCRRRSSRRCKSFYRYLDVDGDGIAARTLPGVHPKGAFFTRGSGHNKFGGYTEDRRRVPGGAWTASRASIQRRGAGRARAGHPAGSRAPRCGIVTVGGCDAAVREAIDHAGRATASRSTTCACAASRSATRSRRSSTQHDVDFVVEQNRDAQLRSRCCSSRPACPNDKLRLGPLLRRASR